MTMLRCPGCQLVYHIRSFHRSDSDAAIGDHLICGYCLTIFILTALDPLTCRILTTTERQTFLETEHGHHYFDAVKNMTDAQFMQDLPSYERQGQA